MVVERQAPHEVHYVREGNNTNVIMLLLLLGVVLLVLYYGGSFLRNTTPQVSVPKQVDVNVNTPQQ